MNISAINRGSNMQNALIKNSAFKLGGVQQDKKKADNEKDKNSSSIKAKTNSTEEAIDALKKQIENVKNNKKLDDDTKKYKIDAINKQIDELKELERQSQMEETMKTMSGGDKSEMEKNLRQKAKKQKEELEKRASGLEDIEVTISEDSFKSLVRAQMALDGANKANTLKTKKGAELQRAKIEQRNDQELGQSIANEVKKEQVGTIAEKTSKTAGKEFEQEHSSLSDIFNSADFHTLNNEQKVTVIKNYHEAKSRFIKKKINEITDTDDFNRQFEYSNEKKQAAISKLEDSIGNLKDAYIEYLSEANEEAKKAGESGNITETDEQNEVLNDVVESVVQKEVGPAITEEIQKALQNS